MEAQRREGVNSAEERQRQGARGGGGNARCGCCKTRWRQIVVEVPRGGGKIEAVKVEWRQRKVGVKVRGGEGKGRRRVLFTSGFFGGVLVFSVLLLFGNGGRGRCWSIRRVLVLFFLCLLRHCGGSFLFWLALPGRYFLVDCSVLCFLN